MDEIHIKKKRKFPQPHDNAEDTSFREQKLWQPLPEKYATIPQRIDEKEDKENKACRTACLDGGKRYK
jgi:hypothetical protein